MILIYAFSNHWGTNISHRTLIEFQKQLVAPLSRGAVRRTEGFEPVGVDFKLINMSPQPFFNKYIEHNYYSLIIGLGDGPKFIDKIRIEIRAKNSYNDQSIYPFSPIYLDLSLPPIDDYDHRYFDVGTNMGTYNCNYLAYRTQLLIDQKKLDTKHLFLHLPPKSNAIILSQHLIDFFTLNRIL